MKVEVNKLKCFRVVNLPGGIPKGLPKLRGLMKAVSTLFVAMTDFFKVNLLPKLLENICIWMISKKEKKKYAINKLRKYYCIKITALQSWVVNTKRIFNFDTTGFQSTSL